MLDPQCRGAVPLEHGGQVDGDGQPVANEETAADGQLTDLTGTAELWKPTLHEHAIGHGVVEVGLNGAVVAGQ